MTEEHDEFESIFGEAPKVELVSKVAEIVKVPLVDGRGYGSWLPTSPAPSTPSHDVIKSQIKMTATEAVHVIDEILSRKPPVISPTIPKMEPDLNIFNDDSLDLDSSLKVDTLDNKKRSSQATSVTRTPLKKVATPQSKSTKPATPAITKSPTLERAIKTNSSNTTNITRNSTTASTTTNNSRLMEIQAKMEEIWQKEQFSEVIEEWKSILMQLERTETIENAKSPRDLNMISSCAFLVSWIAEHLVDLSLKRIQMKAITNADSAPILAQLAQVTAMREQAKQSWLRACHLSPKISATNLSPYQTLSTFTVSLNKCFRFS